MKNKKLVLAMAECMGIDVYWSRWYKRYFIRGAIEVSFSALVNGTQLNEFIEKEKIYITPFKDKWCASIPCSGVGIFKDKDRNTAIFKCIAELLNVEYEEV